MTALLSSYKRFSFAYVQIFPSKVSEKSRGVVHRQSVKQARCHGL